MKRRYQYTLLFGIPGLFISALAAFFIFGATAGFLWLFVLGDDRWPDPVNQLLPLLLAVVFLAIWFVSIGLGYRTGKRLEPDERINRKHLLISAGLTVAPILVIVLHQLSVGNLGPKSESELCSDYCRANGSVVSELSAQNAGDRSCTCYDGSGRQLIRTPVSDIMTAQ